MTDYTEHGGPSAENDAPTALAKALGEHRFRDLLGDYEVAPFYKHFGCSCGWEQNIAGMNGWRSWVAAHEDHVADALLAPGGVVAGIVAEAVDAAMRSPYDEDGYCKFCGNHCGKAHSPVCRWADLHDARNDGAAEVRARVEAVAEEATERAYFGIALEKMLTIQTSGPDRAHVPPHWREAAELAASVPVADLRVALETRPIPPADGGTNE